MITKKKITIPIFDIILTVVIYDKWEEIGPTIDKRFVYDYNPNEGNRGVTIHSGSYVYVGIKSDSEMTIAHEAVHIVNCIWYWIGYTPHIENDEVDAYLLAYIYKKIKDVFNTHNN